MVLIITLQLLSQHTHLRARPHASWREYACGLDQWLILVSSYLLTLLLEASLSADNASINIAPTFVTDGTPTVVETDFYTASRVVGSSQNPDSALYTHCELIIAQNNEQLRFYQ